MPDEPSTADKILDAARKVFVRLGPAKARMRDVADEADITQSLLHYYFRTRDDLYEAVFERELKRFIMQQINLLTSDQPLVEKLQTIAHDAIDFHMDNPHLAAFVAFETHYNEENALPVRQIFSEFDLSVLQKQVDAHADAQRQPAPDARHVLVNMMSMCLFPFIAAPILRSMMDMDKAAYRTFLEQRKQQVPQFIAAALRGSASVAEPS